ncbi:ATPase family protein [Novymonas esmeraldas]|uniref:ATPase family protein n=1 Tax=Novymonas esmeraldas TaxID=1808958 RepID=A0AAW0EUY3_9TRYP
MDSYADLLNLNFMYSLRTGNLLTDMMIAALLPLVTGAVAYITRTWWPQMVSQIISYVSSVDSTTATFKTMERGSGLYFGNTLRVALSTYVTKVLKPRFDVAELKYVSVPGKTLREAASYTEALRDYCFVEAGPAKELPMVLTQHLELKQDETGDEGAGNSAGSTQEAGKAGSGGAKAATESLFTITQYRQTFPLLHRLLRFSQESTARDEAVTQLEGSAAARDDLILALLDHALDNYRRDYKEASTKTDRYLYQPLLTRPKLGIGVAGAEDKTEKAGAMECNRYLLRSEKTFQSLFFPAKSRLIHLINDFENKTGKYAIPGYPQKLVLLLYGPPGTGKTSLAKAVAAYTKRDLFAISLSRVRDNEELLQYMFSGRVNVKNEKNEQENNYRYNRSDDTSTLLDPAKLVYILEDVDATTAVVLKDDSAEAGDTDETPRHARRKRKSKTSGDGVAEAPSRTGDSSSGDDGSDGAVAVEESSDDDGAEEEVAAGSDAEAVEKQSGDDDGSGETTRDGASTRSTEREVVAVTTKGARKRSALTIDGLTNALNGVLDFPQRIVIMTTNHIEKLHTSLLRPGVVTMKLHMHNFDAASAVAMVEHYFSHTTMDAAQLEELRALVNSASVAASKVDVTTSVSEDGATTSTAETRGFSPAELEQRCAECDTVEELLEALRQGSRVNIF